jgi:hypothetical protein
MSSTRAGVVAVWARLELSVIAMMVLGVALSARPLLSAEGGVAEALRRTVDAFAAFMMGELLCMPVAAWFDESRRWRRIRPLVAAAGVAGAVAGLAASSPAARALGWALAGAGAEAAQAWIAGGAVRSPLLRRPRELLAISSTCVVALALGIGYYVLASGPPAGIRTVVACCVGQATVVVLTALHTLYPPDPAALPRG